MLNETVTIDIFGQGFPSGANSGTDFFVVLWGNSVTIDLFSDSIGLFKKKIYMDSFIRLILY
jgi:hypothetical protein